MPSELEESGKNCILRAWVKAPGGIRLKGDFKANSVVVNHNDTSCGTS